MCLGCRVQGLGILDVLECPLLVEARKASELQAAGDGKKLALGLKQESSQQRLLRIPKPREA